MKDCKGCEAIAAETGGRLTMCDGCSELVDMSSDEMLTYEAEPEGLTPAEVSRIRHEWTLGKYEV